MHSYKLSIVYLWIQNTLSIRIILGRVVELVINLFFLPNPLGILSGSTSKNCKNGSLVKNNLKSNQS